TLPVNLGLPWGLWATGFVPFLPLPAKLSYKVGEPIHVGHDPEAARRPDVVRDLYRKVTGIMQDMLDDLASRRRLPVIGCRAGRTAATFPGQQKGPPTARSSPRA